MKLDSKQSLKTVELSTLPNGSVFGHDKHFWIKTDIIDDGYITCVNLWNGSVDGYRPSAKVVPQPDAKAIGLVY